VTAHSRHRSTALVPTVVLVSAGAAGTAVATPEDGTPDESGPPDRPGERPDAGPNATAANGNDTGTDATDVDAAGSDGPDGADATNAGENGGV
jgi:hypothetical protein